MIAVLRPRLLLGRLLVLLLLVPAATAPAAAQQAPTVTAPTKPKVVAPVRPGVAKAAKPKPQATKPAKPQAPTGTVRKSGKAARSAAGVTGAPPALPRDADPELVELDGKARRSDTEAQVELAARFADEGSAAGLQRGRYWYERAASAGDADAAYALAGISRGGLTGRVDIDQALGWYRKAAEAGNADAMFDLGLVYAEGQGVPADRPQAAHWLERAADAGVARAFFTLGTLYEAGVDGAPDLQIAAGWYRQAAAAGDVTAKLALERLVRGGSNVVVAETPAPPSRHRPGAAMPAVATAAHVVPVDQAGVKEIQTKLRALGFKTGPADGHLSKRTSAAIRAYQKAKGLKVDGRASQALLAKLRSAT